MGPLGVGRFGFALHVPRQSRHAGPERAISIDGLAGSAAAGHVGRPHILLMGDVDFFLAARDFLLARRERYAEAYDDFRWPTLDRFNWALDYFDPMARGNDAVALWIVRDDGTERRHTVHELAERSDRVAGALTRL